MKLYLHKILFLIYYTMLFAAHSSSIHPDLDSALMKISDARAQESVELYSTAHASLSLP